VALVLLAVARPSPALERTSAPPVWADTTDSTAARTAPADTTDEDTTTADTSTADTTGRAAAPAPARAPDSARALKSGRAPDSARAADPTRAADSADAAASSFRLPEPEKRSSRAARPPASLQADTTDADTTEADTTAARRARGDTTTTGPPAITDTLAVPLDSLTRADTLAVADTGRAARYLHVRERRRPSLFARTPSMLSVWTDPANRRQVTADTMMTRYTVGPSHLDGSARYPLTLSRDEYRRERRGEQLRANWRAIAEQQRRRDNQRGGLGVNVVVPGGRQSAFSTIFGKPEVDLRVNGQANVNAGFNYRRSDQQVAITGQASQVDPQFKQDLRLGITGTIGDKMQIDVDWDTESQFNYQNQIRLKYTGYEDEIIQSIEAGNVFLETPSQLISGGQSLFGIKSELQLGDLTLTTVASQQEGQSNSLTIEGGAETTEFTLRPTDYEENTHFLLSYFFRNTWQTALSNPPNITLSQGFSGITDIEVWKLQTQADPENEDVRRAVGLVDLGESPQVTAQANQYTDAVLPNSGGAAPVTATDRYSEDDLAALRDGTSATTPSTYLNTTFSELTGQDYQVGVYEKLEQGQDYTLDSRLGYLSLKQRLQDNEALAVAFRYQAQGQTFEVGDFASESGGTTGGQNADRLVLKLLRPSNLTQPSGTSNPAAWYLQMRNIYSLRGRGFNQESFDLEINYEPSGQTPTNTLPDLSGSQTLLQLLGLDRLTEDGAPRPDDRFDFINGLTIDQSEGTIIFPYLEPFGTRLTNVIEQEGGDVEALKDRYVFEALYDRKKENAKNNSEQDVYGITGSYKGASKGFYDLKAFAGLVEGSIEVTSGGASLQEGTDYVVDYQGGTVTILNQQYLAEGRKINISYEQNSFANLQRKTLLGARANWSMDDRFSLGGTVMRLSQRSPVDKFRVGEEPLLNTIWGVDGSLDLKPRWLTQALDALPLIQTKAESAISVSGEFARLQPGHTTTEAFERTRDDLQEEGRDFAPDELNGVSYIDSFEGFENSFSLKQQPSAWQISAPPDSIGLNLMDQPGSRDDSVRTSWRGLTGWYQLNRDIVETLSDAPAAFEETKELVETQEVFPNRPRNETNPTISTLDVYFDPSRRGAYNYTGDLQTFLNTPKQVWGGFVQRIPEGYTDFNVQNIQFVEFIVKPYPEYDDAANDDAALYIDLGSISEDVVPNGKLNSEDGLSSSVNPANLDVWSRLPGGQQNAAVDVTGNVTEDLGFDGLASYDPSAYDPLATESDRFRSFLDALPTGGSAELQAIVARAQEDPSADDYHYFEDDNYFDDPSLFPDGASFQERLSQWYAGIELNSYEAQNQLGLDATVRRGITREPDSEDLNFNATIDTENNYYQYRVPLSREVLDRQAAPRRTDDYVVGEIEDEQGNGTGWYKVRIPIEQFTRRVGNIQDFSLIESIRMWTTGHAGPMTLRFATLELVGSQWRNSDAVATEDDRRADEANLRVASINNEEDAGVYRRPIGAVVSQNRTARGQRQPAREQSLVLQVDSLEGNIPDDPQAKDPQRGVFKTYAQGFDLLKYSNLRMYAHLHGTLNGQDLTMLPEGERREKVRLFIRLGANETGDYYEYEQPLTPSLLTAGNPDALWRPDQNSVNIRLSALNQLKVARDGDPRAVRDSIYWNTERRNGPVKPGAPDAEAFAPPGTRIGVKGTPSLRNINTIVIGVRSGAGPGEVVDNATVWVNELRTSGYDEEPGWGALANANIKLADLGRVQGNFQRQTDGFGALNSTLSNRQQQDQLNWSLTADVNANKLLPERFGWQIPLSFQMQSRRVTPRFDPNRGDVRVSEIVQQVQGAADSTLAAPREVVIDSVRRAAQTRSVTRTMTARVQKQGSDSPWLQKTIDGVSLNFNYADTDERSPSSLVSDRWNWQSTFDYQLNFSRPRTVQPLGFLGEVPVLGALSGLAFNYVPQSLNFSASAQREYSLNRARTTTPGNNTPALVDNPFRDRHDFSHSRQFGLQYNPFEFLNLNYSTNVRQSLNPVGVSTVFQVIDGGNRIQAVVPDTAAFYDRNPDLRESTFVASRLQTRREDRVLRGLLEGRLSPRTSNYDQRFTGTLRPTFLNGPAFDWVSLQDIVYEAQFQWQNRVAGEPTGASVRNQLNLRTGLTLNPNRIWQDAGFYQALKEAQEQSGSRSRGTQGGGQRGGGQRAGGQGRDAPPDEADEDDASDEGGGAEDGADQEADDEPSGPSWLEQLPLPTPGDILRGLALTVLDMRDVSVQYTNNQSSQSSNVGRVDPSDSTDIATSYSLFDALRGKGPSIGYRLGLDRRIPVGQRVIRDRLNVSDAFANQNNLQARATLSPSRSFQINLNWNAQWSNNESVTFSAATNTPGGPPGGGSARGGVATIRTEDGTSSATAWSFGGGYRSLFERQLETLRGDLSALDGNQSPDADGRVALTNRSVADDFRDTYLSGTGPIGQRGTLPLPLPNWTINYSGIGQWPIVQSVAQSVSLRHSYSTQYQSGFRSVATSSETQSVTVGGQTLEYASPDFRIGGTTVDERFQPLIGLNVSWIGGLQTSVEWAVTNRYDLSTSSLEVVERTERELSLTASFQQRGLKFELPLLGRINNRISLDLTLKRAIENEQRYNLRRALEAAANAPGYDPQQALEGDNVTVIAQTTRTTIEPRISYQFSDRVNASFNLSYVNLDGDSRTQSFTEVQGGFNVQVSVSQN
jgi:cell surface protein SprA